MSVKAVAGTDLILSNGRDGLPAAGTHCCGVLWLCFLSYWMLFLQRHSLDGCLLVFDGGD